MASQGQAPIATVGHLRPAAAARVAQLVRSKPRFPKRNGAGASQTSLHPMTDVGTTVVHQLEISAYTVFVQACWVAD